MIFFINLPYFFFVFKAISDTFVQSRSDLRIVLFMNGIRKITISGCAIAVALLFLSSFSSCCSTRKVTAQPAPSENVGEAPVKLPKGKAFSFVQLADPQLGFISDNADQSADSALLARAIIKINSLRPDFVVFTGDHVNASTNAAQLECFKTLLGRIDRRVTYWLLPGNHDIGGGSTDAKVDRYIARYGYDRFSFTHKGCSFIGINTCIIKDDNQAREQEQWEWLESELAKASDSRCTFVLGHHSFFLNSFTEATSYSNQLPEVREKYWNLFSSNGVDCVIAGHLHDNKFSRHQGIDMVTVGPVGRPLGKGYSGVAVWKVSEDGSHSYKYYSIEEFERLETL